jgi:hypothetical protein
MNDSASGLAKVLLQVISRDFSKFSPVTFGRMPMPQDDLTIMRLAHSPAIQLSLARFHRRAIRCLPPQFRLDKKIEIAIHHCLNVTRFRAGPMVLHHLVRLKDV